jgi:hypothetical protein
MSCSDIHGKKIEQPEFSLKFCKQAEKMGFTTIGQIVNLKPIEIIAKDGFDYEWLGELKDYLMSKGLLNLLQPIPGRTYD